jgi:hypothetical protein
MRQPPGEVLSLQTCIEVAMVDPEELASTADKIAKTISNLDPDLSECKFPIVSGRSGRSSRRFIVSTHLPESSHRRCTIACHDHRYSHDRTEVPADHSLFSRNDSSDGTVRASPNGR